MLVSKNVHLEIVKCGVENGADVNKEGRYKNALSN